MKKDKAVLIYQNSFPVQINFLLGWCRVCLFVYLVFGQLLAWFTCPKTSINLDICVKFRSLRIVQYTAGLRNKWFVGRLPSKPWELIVIWCCFVLKEVEILEPFYTVNVTCKFVFQMRCFSGKKIKSLLKSLLRSLTAAVMETFLVVYFSVEMTSYCTDYFWMYEKIKSVEFIMEQ